MCGVESTIAPEIEKTDSLLSREKFLKEVTFEPGLGRVTEIPKQR